MFVVLCIIGLICSGQTVSYVMYELFGRLSRNAFIVLALIIPIVAGMGINFAITIGAMAAQIAALWVIEWGISGLTGFLVAMLMTMPIAAFFGYLIGKLMNKMKGQEMIGGLILGYFANGLYQLLFLFIFGNLIPLKAPGLVIKGSTGVANTIDLSTDRGFKICFRWPAACFLQHSRSHYLRYYGSGGVSNVCNEENGEEKSFYLCRYLRGSNCSGTASSCEKSILHGQCTNGHFLRCRIALYI